MAGGWNLGLDILDTVELLRPGATFWQSNGALPRKLDRLRGANILGNFYLTGGLSVNSRNGEFLFYVSTSLLTFPL